MWKRSDLAVDELEELDGNVMELCVYRADDGLNGPFNSLYAGLKRTGVLLCVIVDGGDVGDDVKSCNLDEIQILESLLVILNLQSNRQKKQRQLMN